MELCFLADFSTQNKSDAATESKCEPLPKDKLIDKLELHLSEWQSELPRLKVLKRGIEEWASGKVQLKEAEVNELLIRLKKRVIAMSDPNKFDLE